MSLKFRAIGALVVMTLAACTDMQHPIERQLSGLKPVAVVPLASFNWPAGTLLCPMTPYQSALPGASPTARRVNAFLEKQRFKGDEGHWSLVVIKPAPAGEAGIEQLVFKRDNYDVVTSRQRLGETAETVPVRFEVQDCVDVKEARVLVTRGSASARKLISFGTEK